MANMFGFPECECGHIKSAHYIGRIKPSWEFESKGCSINECRCGKYVEATD